MWVEGKNKRRRCMYVCKHTCMHLGADKGGKYWIGRDSKWGRRMKLIEGREKETEGETWGTEARGMSWEREQRRKRRRGTAGMMRQGRWRKLIKPESKNGIGGGMRQSKEKGGGAISSGTRQDDLALNHRCSWIKQIILSFSVSIPPAPPPSNRV